MWDRIIWYFLIRNRKGNEKPPSTESRWRKRKAIEESGKPMKKAESRWRKQKAVEESGKPLRKAESRWRKSESGWGKSDFGKGKSRYFPRDSLVSGDFGDSFSYAICYHMCTRIYLFFDPLTKLTLLTLCAWLLHSRTTTPYSYNCCSTLRCRGANSVLRGCK